LITPEPKRILLDTSVLINLLHGRREPLELLGEFVQRGFALATSSINVAEVYAGMRPGEERATEQLLSAFSCLELTPEIARKAGEITAAERRIGRSHSLDDMMIAATAMAHGYALLTDNRKDFQIPGLELFPLR
jgi:predicted nucleic acid-binding protein